MQVNRSLIEAIFSKAISTKHRTAEGREEERTIGVTVDEYWCGREAVVVALTSSRLAWHN